MSNLGIGTPLSKILLLEDISFQRYELTEIVNHFSLVAMHLNAFKSEMHLRQVEFTHKACGSFTKTKERIKRLKEEEIQDVFIKTN